MITPQELRLDSLLYVPGLFGPSTLVEAVESINAKGEISTKSTQAHFSCYRPIELTEEWLFKLGYECDKNEYCVSGFDRFNVFQSVKGPYIFCDDEKSIRYVEYVHQLQNIFFALTGEELTINE
ncbi:hypothetical protein [Chryseobacterium indologenes]|uniref:hypothetical protein n=1 Tax=Chryseobacterium indologenes TaxID=253 RepID=UPI001629A562|nr:hypothetical protein [Chryseobacterium indologenes]